MPLRTVHAIRLLIGTILVVGVLLGAWFAYRVIRAELQNLVHNDVTVTIPEGVTSQEIDLILARAGVTATGTVAAIAQRDNREGYLFPDTYRFLPNTDPEAVVARLVATFDRKAQPLLAGRSDAATAVIVASLLEREVTDPADQRLVAGIIERRLKERIPLQIDATICYIKKLAGIGDSCYPITVVDLTNASPYNTYLYRGLPPGPIGNPGVGALKAALEPEASPYLFYLSDPATGRTIFSVTNEEHERNKAQYLR